MLMPIKQGNLSSSSNPTFVSQHMVRCNPAAHILYQMVSQAPDVVLTDRLQLVDVSFRVIWGYTHELQHSRIALGLSSMHPIALGLSSMHPRPASNL